MSKKFRNSLFGFNRDDVLKYVVETRESDAKKSKMIDEANKRIVELEQNIEKLSSENADIISKLNTANAKISDFEQREEALTHLSESIGRLYLVAQANANAVISAANESAKLSLDVTDRNIEFAASAESQLAEINRVLNEKTKEYTMELAALKQQLANVKEQVAENKASISERQAELEIITTGVEE